MCQRSFYVWRVEGKISFSKSWAMFDLCVTVSDSTEAHARGGQGHQSCHTFSHENVSSGGCTHAAVTWGSWLPCGWGGMVFFPSLQITRLCYSCFSGKTCSAVILVNIRDKNNYEMSLLTDMTDRKAEWEQVHGVCTSYWTSCCDWRSPWNERFLKHHVKAAW